MEDELKPDAFIITEKKDTGSLENLQWIMLLKEIPRFLFSAVHCSQS